MERVTVTEVVARKGGARLSMVAVYDYPMARVCDEAGVDILLVGDSLGQVVLGFDTTLPVTLEQLLHHTAAVSRGAERALVVADMPFMTFGISVEASVANAGRCLKEAGASAVKLEGGTAVAEHVARMVSLGIPVMGHLGLTPQSIHKFGGMKVQARTEAEAQRLLAEARMLEDAGAFSIVLEGIPTDVAARVTEAVQVPTIGIGAGVRCDGQVLVFHDLVGWSDPGFAPRFVKRFADARGVMLEAVGRFVAEVAEGTFPDDAHSYGGKK